MEEVNKNPSSYSAIAIPKSTLHSELFLVIINSIYLYAA